MSCGFDLGCYFEPAFAIWRSVSAFWGAWWPLFLFDAGMIVGALLGIKMVLGVNTLGVAFVLYDRFKPVPEPIETDLSPRDREPAPKKKRGGILDDLLERDKNGLLRFRKKQ